ncbi:MULTISPECIES: ABC transporter substrate-binding protein [Microbacterium]|uniref:Substrate-binding protein n=1 Tax=Microbacterium saccharophilum TaxID=1213358 RepID=A0A7Z7D0F1_9MICO|nr:MULTISPECIES: ABC transporter substrate-binding protein [Microbacterium]SFI61247.1 substrate-binding protein [Microbacterium saccharophilum]
MTLTRKLTGIVAGALALALAGCAGPAGEATDQETLLVYADVSLTGVLAGSSQAQVEGLTAAVDSINAQGGIEGRQLELKVVNDELDATKALTLLQEQLDTRKPDFVWHGVSSNVALAILPALTRNGVFSMGTPSNDAINDPAMYPYAFATQAKAKLDAEAAVARLVEEGVRRVALITNSDANGQNAATSYMAAFDAAGIEYAYEDYTPQDIDMVAQLQRLQATNPEVLFVEGYGAPGGYVLKSRTKLGWDIPTRATNSIGNGVNLGLVSDPRDWVNLELIIHPINTAERTTGDSAAFETLVSSLDEQGSAFDQSMQLYTYPWDALHLYKAAVEQAGTTDAEAVTAAMESLQPVDGESPFLTFPTMRYTPDDHFLNLEADEAFIYLPAGPTDRGTLQPAN